MISLFTLVLHPVIYFLGIVEFAIVSSSKITL